MVRLLLRALLAIAANAIGLIVAAWILDDMALDPAGFVVAVLIFSAIFVVIQPFIVKVSIQTVRALAGSAALVATFVGLVGTVALTDGLRISGATTWILATIIVWLISLIGGIVLPALLLKRAVDERGGR